MTEDGIREILVRHFMKLPYFITENNVLCHNGNETFTVPEEKTWFELTVMFGDGGKSGLGENAPEHFDGVFQIDICVSLGQGRDELDDIYSELRRLFRAGLFVDDTVEINKVTTARETADELCYRKQVRVNWSADIYID